MGLFSGGFLGGGTDESTSTTNTSQTIVTNTETDVGDVGLTGEDAVRLAGVLSAESRNVTAIQAQSQQNQFAVLANLQYQNQLSTNQVTRSQILSNESTFKALLNAEDKAQARTTSLLGKLTSLVGTVGGAAQDTLNTAVRQQQESYEKLLTITSDTTNPALSLGKDVLMVAAILAIGLIFFRQ